MGRRRTVGGAATLAVVAALLTAPPSVATPPPGTTCSIFAADNIWHADISSLPVHPKSSAWISTMGGTGVHIHPDFGPSEEPMPYGLPYVVVPGSHPKVSVDFLYDDESDPGPYPFDASTPIEGGSDRHAIMIDKDDCVLYELFDAEYAPGASTAGSGAIFQLNSNALRPAGWTSADAAGLPIFAGLVRLDEVEAGFIDHAIRFTGAPTDRSYVWPARHQAGAASNPNYPPMGARFRLRATFDITGFRPDTQIILRAMKTYGLIMSDNGGDWFFQGTAEDGWDNDMLDELKTVTAAQFEAVDVSSLMVNPDSGQVGGGDPGPGVNVTVADFSFTPKTATAARGDTVQWAFGGPSSHTATDRTGMTLFDSGSKGAGTTYSFVFVSAGAYSYRCSIHTQMKGTIKVPMTVTPSSGGTGTSFTAAWASAAPPAGYVFDVQIARPGDPFVEWKVGVTTTTSPFTPDDGVGSYSFRARLRKAATGKAAKYSAAARITVT